MKEVSGRKHLPMRYKFQDTFSLKEIRSYRHILFPSGEWNESIAAFLLLHYFVNGEDDSIPASDGAIGLLGGFDCSGDVCVYVLNGVAEISTVFGSRSELGAKIRSEFKILNVKRATHLNEESGNVILSMYGTIFLGDNVPTYVS
jgi:hypothetical protein